MAVAPTARVAGSGMAVGGGAKTASSLSDAAALEAGAIVARLGDPAAQDAVAAERRVLGLLEAGCSAPIGVASAVADGSASLWASVHRPGGGARLDRRARTACSDHDRAARLLAVAEELAAELIAAGAGNLAPLGATA